MKHDTIDMYGSKWKARRGAVRFRGADMKRLQAFKFELKTTLKQGRLFARFSGCARFVYNKALEMQIELRENGKNHLGYAALCKKLTDWRHDPQMAWLAAAPTHPLQQALKDLEKAYTNYFSKRAQYPRFKKRGRRESFRYPDPKQIKLDQGNSRISLPKLGWIRYRNSRAVQGTVKNVTVSFRTGKWFIAIQTEREVEVATPEGEAIGIDMGIARFATISDGTYVEPLNSFRRHEAALRRAQKAMSRKEKFSNNWIKAIAKVQRIQTRITNVRKDYLHKLSTKISKNHAIVCVEKLQVGNMSRSAAGTVETPGKNVRAKSGLNKSILDQGWYEFRRQLDYKLAWNGGWLELVPPQNTSRTCPACSHVSAENRQTQAEFRCVQCGFEGNADVVGATNILRAGLARLVCQANEITRRQQKPTEALLALCGILVVHDGEEVNRQDDSSIKPIELDSENMLAYCLSKLGLSEFEEIDGLNGKSKKAEITVRVPQLVLKELGLF